MSTIILRRFLTSQIFPDYCCHRLQSEMYISIALAVAVVSNGFTSAFASDKNTIDQVDWDELLAMLKMYLCSGNSQWYDNLNKDKNKKHISIMAILSLATVVICEHEINTTIPQIYKDYYRPLLVGSKDLVRCYRSAVWLMLSRFACCWEDNKSVKIVMGKLRDIAKNEVIKNIMSYLTREDILNKSYFILRKIKGCTSCPREKFQIISKTPGSRHRVKRVYDVYSWMLVLKKISELDINNIDISDNARTQWSVKSTRHLVFLGEGLVFCSATHLLND